MSVLRFFFFFFSFKALLLNIFGYNFNENILLSETNIGLWQAPTLALIQLISSSNTSTLCPTWSPYG